MFAQAVIFGLVTALSVVAAIGIGGYEFSEIFVALALVGVPLGLLAFVVLSIRSMVKLHHPPDIW